LQISDCIVSAAFLRQSRAFEESESSYAARMSKLFAALSMMLILIPLFLTAIFIARTLMRDYVRRQLSEAQRHAAQDEDEEGGQDSGMSGEVTRLLEPGDWGAGASPNGEFPCFDSLRSYPAFSYQALQHQNTDA
jgi:hypothetical protein